MSIHIIKYSGERVAFSAEKIRKSLEKTGASAHQIESILTELPGQIYDGISSKDVFKIIHRMLKTQSKELYSKYGLKQAIQQLGPTGYPFEVLIGEILKKLGFTVRVGIVMEGHCVTHEVDVFAEKGNLQYIVECKFRNQPGFKSDVKVPLYINSRFQDIEKKLNPSAVGKKLNGWVITNTRFTTDALTYGTCAGLRMMSWDYPEEMSLKKVMTELNLQPITSLNTLSKKEKEDLINKGIVLCNSLLENQDILLHVLSHPSKVDRVVKEIKQILNINP